MVMSDVLIRLHSQLLALSVHRCHAVQVEFCPGVLIITMMREFSPSSHPNRRGLNSFAESW